MPNSEALNAALQLTKMLEGTHPASKDQATQYVNEICAHLGLNLQIIHPPTICQSKPDLLGTKTKKMNRFRKLTYLFTGAILFQTLTNIACYLQILNSFQNKLTSRGNTSHINHLLPTGKTITGETK